MVAVVGAPHGVAEKAFGTSPLEGSAIRSMTPLLLVASSVTDTLLSFWCDGLLRNPLSDALRKRTLVEAHCHCRRGGALFDRLKAQAVHQ